MLEQARAGGQIRLDPSLMSADSATRNLPVLRNNCRKLREHTDDAEGT